MPIATPFATICSISISLTPSPQAMAAVVSMFKMERRRCTPVPLDSQERKKHPRYLIKWWNEGLMIYRYAIELERYVYVDHLEAWTMQWENLDTVKTTKPDLQTPPLLTPGGKISHCLLPQSKTVTPVRCNFSCSIATTSSIGAQFFSVSVNITNLCTFISKSDFQLVVMLTGSPARWINEVTHVAPSDVSSL